ncbi:hypothetical protein [Bacillus seohaeanensis]|uniref:DUF3168 domain-containing protein n=1 Tax=Bacillus seohaeanensis TaxID=284580 RepID=A0ABW5RST0_9BACI
MSLNSLIISTLNSLAPVAFQKYKGSEDTYITFFEYNQGAAVSADDDETVTRHSIQVDVWSKGDYTDLVKEVKAKMKQVGFTKNYETELYEEEAEDVIIYHKVLRFYYFKEAI